jgi:release factor glutamine methyltransferase
MDWTVDEGVYAPREDSRLMQGVLAEQDFSGGHVLDMGTGSGILAYTVMMNGASQVTAVDINPAAVANARENLQNHEVAMDRVRLVISDLFDAVEGTFDSIVFNPPYVPGQRELETMEERAWVGGDRGRAVTDRFLDVFTEYLADNGEVFLLQSSRNDVEQTLDRFEEQGVDAEVVAREKVSWEQLVVVHARSNVD